MTLALRSAIAGLVLVAAIVVARPAGADVRAPVLLDGVAAVVGDARIFRSDVTARVRLLLDRLSKDPVKRPRERAELEKQVLARMIDEMLIARDAAKLHIRISEADVAEAIGFVAEQNKVDPKALDAEMARHGMTRTDYEDEIRRQVLDGRWLMLRGGSKVPKAASDPAAYQSALEKERDRLLVDLRSHTYIEVR